MTTTTRRQRVVLILLSHIVHTNAPSLRAFNPNSPGNNCFHFAITQTTSV
jgi:hypothetical protein